MYRVQEALILKLLGDINLQVMLGNNAPATGSVMEDQSFNMQDQKYPRIHVGLISEKPFEVQQTSSIKGKRIHTVYLDIHVFSRKNSSRELGAIDQAVREILDGGQLDFPNVYIYNCEFDSFVKQDKDTETGIWEKVVRYRVVARNL